MAYIVKMPKLGLEMERGTLLEWHVEEGDTVEEGEVIAEIESEKSIGEIEAREDGVLRLADLDEGETVPPGTPIGIVGDIEEDISHLKSEFDAGDGEPEGEVETGDDKPAEMPAEPTTGTETTEPASDPGSPSSSTSPASDEQVKASPRAEQRAEELGVDLAGIDGSGPQGAITADDVEAVAESATDAEASTRQVKASPRAKRRAEELDVDLAGIDGSGPQGAITADDVEAATEETPSEAVASVAADADRAEGERTGRYRTATLVVDGDEADALLDATELAANAFDLDVSPLDVLLVAISAALGEHPVFNATFEDETHQLHCQRDVAIAADSDGELVTPVLDGVEARTFGDLVEARQDRTEEAVTSGVSGGRATFALALAEEFDGDVESLVTPPTVAGLVANCSRRRAVPAENGVSLRRCLSLSLAYDTRAVDDGDAEGFLGTLLEHIGNSPELVLRTYGK